MNLQSISKACAGALATGLVALLAKHGVVLNSDVSSAVSVLIAAAVGFVVVYVSPKNK